MSRNPYGYPKCSFATRSGVRFCFYKMVSTNYKLIIKTMDHQKVWDKVLSKGEDVKHSFSVGKKYIKFNLIVWGLISLPLLFASGVGVIIFLLALFYFAYYLKVANAYAFTNKRVIIHKGWISTNTISIDYSQITDVRVRESFIDKALTKTGNIAVNTAGTGHIEVVLSHVEAPYEIKKILDEIRD